MLTFIQGTLVGTHSDHDETNNESNNDNGQQEEHPNSLPLYVPNLQETGKLLDKKQCVAFEIICCNFLLQLILEGCDGETALGKYLNATLNCKNTLSRDGLLIRKLKARGAEEQLCSNAAHWTLAYAFN